MPSASGCSRPKGPTREGPQRFCMRPKHLALQQHRVGDRHQRDDEDDRDLEDAEQQECLKLGEMAHSGLALSS